MVPIFSFIKSHLLLAIIFASFHLISTAGSTVLAVDNNHRSQSPPEERGEFQESRNGADFVLRRTSAGGQQCSPNQDMVWVPSVEKESEFLNDADFLDLSGDGSVIATGRSYDDINIYQRKENNELMQLGQILECWYENGLEQQQEARSWSP